MTQAGVALVAGAGGFIGGHLVSDLLDAGFFVRAVDVKPQAAWHQRHYQAENHGGADLRDYATCVDVMHDVTHVYQLAADMGGMGFIETHKADCMLSVLITTNMLRAARERLPTVERFFFSSSACVYPAHLQRETSGTAALREDDAYPADAEDGYGWEKLFSERMCRHFNEDFGLQTRVARFHNVYGPHGAWNGGREKAPAALARKVATAALTNAREISIWGDGEQRRSFMYVADCVDGIHAITDGDFSEPVNLGSAELVSVNELVTLLEEIAGIPPLQRHYDLTAPQGVRGRNSDNTLFRSRYGWEPSIALREGLTQTYRWIYDQVKETL